jgi:hypothetical protein
VPKSPTLKIRAREIKDTSRPYSTADEPSDALKNLFVLEYNLINIL